MEENRYFCKKCGGKLEPEDREGQFQRIKSGMAGIFPKETDGRIMDFARNYIGYGPNYMFKCKDCGVLRKIIPDGRQRD
jgi:hypothetical protein